MKFIRIKVPFETIKHQRDKQITIVYRADIQLFNTNGC